MPRDDHDSASPSGPQAAALAVYTAEFDKLRTEQFTRMEIQGSAFNFAIVVLGAAIATLAGLATSDAFVSGALLVCLLLPLLGGPLACWFFDNEIMIAAVGTYVAHDRAPRIEQATDGSFQLGRISAFVGLPTHTAWVHLIASLGRWTLLSVPTVLPTLVAVMLMVTQWNETLGRLPVWLAVLAMAVFAVDVILCAAAAITATWVIRIRLESARWRPVG